jgi:DNA polymerase III epsilon subunit-like protein
VKRPREFSNPAQWPDCPIEVAALLFFDIETSGLRPDRGARITEIAVLDRQGLRFSWEQATGADDVDEHLPTLFHYLSGGVVVGHNVGFDFRFVAYVANRLGYQGPNVRFIDTLALARKVLEADDYRLETLVEICSISPEGALHAARVDVRATRTLFWELVERGGIETLSDAGMKRLDWSTF